MVREETGSLDVDNETLISSSTNPGCRVWVITCRVRHIWHT
jgi:hypothetical protein